MPPRSCPAHRSRAVALAQQVVRFRLSVGGYFRRSNAAPGIGLPPFGLPFAFDPAPWYAFHYWCHCRANRPPDMAPRCFRARGVALLPLLPDCRFRHADQYVAERCRRADPGCAVLSAALERQFPCAFAVGESVLFDRPIRKNCFTDTPIQVRKFAANGIEPCRLSGIMPVSTLLDAACPPAVSVSHDPVPGPWWGVDAEMRPCMASSRMLKDAAIAPNSVQRRRETAPIIALHLAFACPLDVQRLARPEAPPPLTWRMRNHRTWTCVFPRVTGLIPRVNIRQTVVAAACLNVERSYHCRLPLRHSATARRPSV